jgi:hypothetical protein
MELVHALKTLWRRRAMVAVGAALAFLVALALHYQMTVFPPGLHHKGARLGAATTELMIDAPQSAIGDLRRTTDPLIARTGIFARFLGANGATGAIARAAGVPVSKLSVEGPLLQVDGVPDPNTAARALGSDRRPPPYIIQVQQGDQLPVLTVYTQAPTKEEARRLADGTATGLSAYLTGYEDREAIPPKRRVEIRQLGSASATSVVTAPGKFKSVAAFVVILGLWCGALLATRSIVAAWRLPESAQHAPKPEPFEIWLKSLEPLPARPGGGDEPWAPAGEGRPGPRNDSTGAT